MDDHWHDEREELCSLGKVVRVEGERQRLTVGSWGRKMSKNNPCARGHSGAHLSAQEDDGLVHTKLLGEIRRATVASLRPKRHVTDRPSTAGKLDPDTVT